MSFESFEKCKQSVMTTKKHNEAITDNFSILKPDQKNVFFKVSVNGFSTKFLEQSKHDMNTSSIEKNEVEKVKLLSFKSSYINNNKEYKSVTKTCNNYSNIEEFSKTVVDDLLKDALEKSKSVQQQLSSVVIDGIEYFSQSCSSSVTSHISLFEWLTIEEFTEIQGKLKIEEYIMLWKLKKTWNYFVKFIKYTTDEICDFYLYKAIFEISCEQYLIPQATASIYFTFELSRVKPKTCLADLYFSFEGQRLVYRPATLSSAENKLLHIIDAKTIFF